VVSSFVRLRACRLVKEAAIDSKLGGDKKLASRSVRKVTRVSRRARTI
jgi:hypothetical protein